MVVVVEEVPKRREEKGREEKGIYFTYIGKVHIDRF